MNSKPGWGTRLFVALICGFFGLAFGGVGLFVGVWPLVQTAQMAWAVQGWQPVSAQVLSANLASSRGSKGGTTYAARVRYAYRYAGQDHEATRIGLDPGDGYDNIGSWHHDWVDRLNDARQRELPVAAWVNPQQPAQAVLERRPRWGLLAFRLPFALIFTAVGVGAAVVMVRALAGRVSPPAKRRSQPTAAASRVNNQRDLGQLSTERPGRLPLPPWPAGTRGDLASGTVHFVRRWPRVLGAVLVVVVLVWLAAALQQTSGLLSRLLHAVPLALLATAALHLLTLRWQWQLQRPLHGQLHGQPQGQPPASTPAAHLVVTRSSVVRRHVVCLSAADLKALGHKLVYTASTGGGPMVEHRCLLAQPPGRPRVQLTPALPADGVQVVAWHLHQALRGAAGPER